VYFIQITPKIVPTMLTRSAAHATAIQPDASRNGRGQLARSFRSSSTPDSANTCEST
jgi:hypothetical protein